MATIFLARRVAEDFDRIVEHLLHHEVIDSEERLDAILEAIQILRSHPLIGRRVEKDRRELVIGRDARGYVALYRYMEKIDAVFVEAIRAQKECGYTRD